MKALFLGSVVERSGKTMVALGLARNFDGKVGFFKPFKENVVSIKGRVVDQDAHLMHSVLGLEDEVDLLSPCTYNVYRPVNMDQIVERYNKVSKDKDLMIIEGTRDITTGYLHGVSYLAIAKDLDADMVLVSTPKPEALDKIFMFKKLCERYEIPLKGVILNNCDDPAVEAFLKDRGVEVLGSIPTVKELKRFRVREVVDALGAEVLVGEEGLDRAVEDVMVGAMNPESAIKYMRRLSKKAVITGGDRSDLQMAALSTDTSCIILTGGMFPPKTVISKAFEAGVPILLVRQDTLTAAEMVDHLIARIDPEDGEKVEMITQAVRGNVNLSKVFDRE